jgi:hypothetical protein
VAGISAANVSTSIISRLRFQQPILTAENSAVKMGRVFLSWEDLGGVSVSCGYLAGIFLSDGWIGKPPPQNRRKSLLLSTKEGGQVV